jgi:Tol biopolymer transport system component
MDRRLPQAQPADKTPEDRLDSWKAIASYLKRDITTVQRWERRESMPVHRHLHDKQGSVYAFRSELDAWGKGRRAEVPRDTESVSEEAGPTESIQPPPVSRLHRRIGLREGLVIGLGVSFIVAVLAVFWLVAEREVTWRDPLADSRAVRLTDLSGTEQAAAISRDGRLVAFLGEADGRTDAWVTEVGSGQYRNLTQGRIAELVNPSIRTLGFSPDDSLLAIWSRKPDGSRADDINIMAVSPQGGALRTYLTGAAEVAWSSHGQRIVYHTTAPGDPLFVEDLRQSTPRRIYIAPAGVHCHFPVWSPDDQYIYFTRGVPPDRWDVWRIQPSGSGLERMTFHDSLVTHPVLLDRRTLLYLASDTQRAGPWLFAMDVERRVTHRLSFGLERYTSLAASADGTRLVATVATSRSSLSRLTLDTEPTSGTTAARVVPISGVGLSPRLGPDYLVYVASRGARHGIWKLQNGVSLEIWGDPHALIVGGPAITSDGKSIAFVVADGEKTLLYVMDSDGKHPRVVSDSLALRGNPAWTPDGKSLVSAVLQGGEPRLVTIPLDGGTPLTLVSEYSLDPVWSPDGQFLLYSGPDVGTTFALRAIGPDGRPYPLPALILSRGARRVVFSRDPHSVVVLRGDISHKNFWLVDLQTGAERQLGELTSEPSIRDFDVSPDGNEIVFDRVEETSQIALIERTRAE